MDRGRQLLGSDVYIHQSQVNFKPGFEGKPDKVTLTDFTDRYGIDPSSAPTFDFAWPLNSQLGMAVSADVEAGIPPHDTADGLARTIRPPM